MDFFQRQAEARSNTALLLLLFILGMLTTALFLHFLIAFIVMAMSNVEAGYKSFVWNWVLFPFDMSIVCFFIILMARLRISELNNLGPDGIARELGGRLVMRGTPKPLERRLYNIVEEMALASGIPVPRVYVQEDEPSINACAIGFNSENAVICVTVGSLEYLTRDELQGVIAHEFSHIVNNDVAMNMKLTGYLFGLEIIVFFAALVFRILHFCTPILCAGTDSRKKDDMGAVTAGCLGFLLLALLVSGLLFLIGGVGLVFGNIIRAAVSRQREYLADASAVQYTRNPAGISGALIKIGSPQLGSRIGNNFAIGMSHMFFGSVFTDELFEFLFQTHPPLVSRILAVDPSFNGVFPKIVYKVSEYEDTDDEENARTSSREILGYGTNISGAASSVKSQTATNVAFSAAPARAKTPVASASADLTSVMAPSPRWHSYSPSNVKTSTLTPNPQNFSNASSSQNIFGESPNTGSATKYAVNASFTSSLDDVGTARVNYAILQVVPQVLDGALVDSVSARAIFYLLLFDKSPQIAQSQQLLISQREDSEVVKTIKRLRQYVDVLGENARLVVARKTAPLLKTITLAEYKNFRSIVVDLCRADGKLDLFEYSLQALIIRELDLFFKLARAPRFKYSKISDVTDYLQVVLSYLAYAGAEKPGDEDIAFHVATSLLEIEAWITPRDELSLANFTLALNELYLATPLVKKICLLAIRKCAIWDGKITKEEIAIVSAITAAMGIPAPIGSAEICESLGV